MSTLVALGHRLRVGLLGLGYWGPNYARLLAEFRDVDLVWACDLDPGALDLVRQRHPSVRLTTDAQEVLADPTVDAVVIATPTSTHARLTLSAFESGKHVLCEKPLAATVAECVGLVEAAESAGLTLMVGHTFIFNPAVRRMRELIEAGEIGRVLYCHCTRTALGPIRRDVNALWDLAPHDVSILLYLLAADPVEVSARGESYLRQGTEDVVFVTLRMEGRIFVSIHLSWLDPYKVRRMTFIGSRRMMIFDDVSADEKLRIFDKGVSYDSPSEEARGSAYGEYKAILRDGDIHIPKLPAVEPLREQLAHFFDCCRYGLTPETDGASALRVIGVLQAAAESLRQNGVSIDLSALSPSAT